MPPRKIAFFSINSINLAINRLPIKTSYIQQGNVYTEHLQLILINGNLHFSIRLMIQHNILHTSRPIKYIDLSFSLLLVKKVSNRMDLILSNFLSFYHLIYSYLYLKTMEKRL